MTSIEKAFEVLGAKIDSLEIEISLLKYDKEKLLEENKKLKESFFCENAIKIVKEGSQI